MMGDDERNDFGEEEDFAAMLEKSFVDSAPLEPGQKVEATVLKITADWVFLDVGQKGEGVLDRKELSDIHGNLTVKEGDRLTTYFLSRRGGELKFTTRLGGGAGSAQLEEAWKSGIPVEGRVEKEIKGGFEVRVLGNTRAFCPYSQISLRRAENPQDFLGLNLPFRITQFSERGRNIVVSHRVLLEEEQQKMRESLKETLREGATVRGTVSSLQKFGAFIDIGGVEGLLPLSEIGWGRVENIQEVLSPGQEVEVVVKQIDWDKNRFSFSLKETLADPWLQVAQKFPEGSLHTGKVVRLAPFGAFVELEPGIDGLLHISRLGAGKKIHHPREALQEGQTVEVRIEGLDREARRISLALAGAEAPAEKEEDFRQFLKEPAKPMGTLGDLLKKQMEKGRKK